MLLWALLVSYSRVYLGVHYPGDVLAGGLWGAACGYVVYVLFRWLMLKVPSGWWIVSRSGADGN
jgi:undecaprenyl-diphosphatase